MKNIFNNWLKFYNGNKNVIINLSLFFGILWTFFIALIGILQPLLFFVINFFLVLPFGLVGGILFALLFIQCMRVTCGEYIIAYVEARIYRIFLRKYGKSIELYNIALTILRNSRSKGIEKVFKKYYLQSIYND
ncbi:hypothetical protein IJD34_07900, partial [bacterium]|nr:hypothetical protein [bacterium]